MECNSCFNAVLSNCLTGFTLAGGFAPGDSYKWVITDQFGKRYSAIVVADANGALTIDADDLPDGFLNPFAGEFLLNVYDAAGVPADIAICQVYNCVKVKITKNNGDTISTKIGNCENAVANGSAILTDYVATENITAFDVVTSDGRVGNSGDVTQQDTVIGIAIADCLIGAPGKVVAFGEITNPAWTWTVGDVIFLNGTSLSTTPPSVGYSQEIGTATATDTINVDLGPAILL